MHDYLTLHPDLDNIVAVNAAAREKAKNEDAALTPSGRVMVKNRSHAV